MSILYMGVPASSIRNISVTYDFLDLDQVWFHEGWTSSALYEC